MPVPVQILMKLTTAEIFYTESHKKRPINMEITGKN
jgi:hypothetical protein